MRLAAQVGQHRRDLRDHLPREVAHWSDLPRGTLAGQPVNVASPDRGLGGIVGPGEECGNDSRLGVARPRGASPGWPAGSRHIIVRPATAIHGAAPPDADDGP